MTALDLTSKPGSKWVPTARHIMESRIHLAKSADLLRMEGTGGAPGKLLAAEKLYLRAATYAEGMAAAHLIRLADNCRQIYERQKKAKQRKTAKGAH